MLVGLVLIADAAERRRLKVSGGYMIRQTAYGLRARRTGTGEDSRWGDQGIA